MEGGLQQDQSSIKRTEEREGEALRQTRTDERKELKTEGKKDILLGEKEG